MDPKKLLDRYIAAMMEAERFMNAAQAAVDRIQAEQSSYFTGSKETAAAKRASLDLTRALADLRRTNEPN